MFAVVLSSSSTFFTSCSCRHAPRLLWNPPSCPVLVLVDQEPRYSLHCTYSRCYPRLRPPVLRKLPPLDRVRANWKATPKVRSCWNFVQRLHAPLLPSSTRCCLDRPPLLNSAIPAALLPLPDAIAPRVSTLANTLQVDREPLARHCEIAAAAFRANLRICGILKLDSVSCDYYDPSASAEPVRIRAPRENTTLEHHTEAPGRHFGGFNVYDLRAATSPTLNLQYCLPILNSLYRSRDLDLHGANASQFIFQSTLIQTQFIMSSNDPSVRRILPQDAPNAQNAGLNSYTFAPQQFPQRETQKSKGHPTSGGLQLPKFIEIA